VNVHVGDARQRQTIQYIRPQDYKVLQHHAELLVIDEAAAIPLPIVKNLLGPYLVFMGSTINGYEGTGRSLSLKLLKQLREQSSLSKSDKASKTATIGSRTLCEITLSEPIRYSLQDPIESWLNNLLCLDCRYV
jgi:N-acetyltransferase 10